MALPAFVSEFAFVFVPVFVSLCVSVFVSVLLTQMVENIDAGCHHWLSLASAALSGVGESLSSSSGREERASSGCYVTHLLVNGWLRPLSSDYLLPPYIAARLQLQPMPPPSLLLLQIAIFVTLISVWPSPPVQPEPELAPPPTEYRIFGRVNRDKSRRTAGRWQVRLGGRQVHQLHLKRWSLADCIGSQKVLQQS